jgi:hypothetical protein
MHQATFSAKALTMGKMMLMDLEDLTQLKVAVAKVPLPMFMTKELSRTKQPNQLLN